MRIALLALLLAAIWPCLSFAQNDTDEIETSASDDASAETEEADETVALDEVRVVGRAQRLYRVDRSDFATRTDSDLQTVPQSVQVLPRELIEDQAARQITDLYRSISGVSRFSYSGVTFRGFRQDEILYDGVRGDPFAGFAVPQLFNIERIDVLKGPAGALYGSGEPGGIINYVTKKPTRTPMRQVELAVGNDDFLSASAELSGPVTEGGAWHYRVGAYADSEKPFRFVTDLENRIADIGINRDFGAASSLLLQLTRIEQDYGGARLRGVPVTDDGRFLTTRRWNHNEPTDFQTLEATVAQARIEHAFSSQFEGDLTLRWFDNDEEQNYHEPIGLIDTDGDSLPDYSARQFRDQSRDNESWSLTANLVRDFSFGSVEHKLLFGGDYAEFDAFLFNRLVNPQEAGGPVPGLSLIDPVYGTTSGADYDLDSIAPRLRDQSFERSGLYLQDQIRLSPRWSLLAGIRWDHFEDANITTGDRFSDDGFSGRLGSSYQLADGIRGYGVVASGFVPQSPGSQDPLAGGPFDPEQSQLHELGLKMRLLDDRIALNLAGYRIVRENILQPDPAGDPGNDGVEDLVAVGEVTSDGFELDLLGDITPRWAINLSYAWNDVRVTEATGSIRNAVGDRFVNAPEHQFGLWTRYDFPAIDSAIAGGVEFVDDRISFSDQRVPDYTIFDISWQTRFDRWLFQLNVKNLFDRVYAESGFLARTGHFPGEPRRVYLSMTYDF
jgi:iron complex outermembrane receptor protein